MKKILIIEDDSVVASIYGNKFTQAGFEVQTATDGAMGLQLLKTFQPDLVQLDLMLPKVNGVEIIKHIRGQPELKSLPIIVLSNAYVASLMQDAWKEEKGVSPPSGPMQIHSDLPSEFALFESP